MYKKIRQLLIGLSRIPNLFFGFNIYVVPEKLSLLRTAFSKITPRPQSFADLGGVWKVNAGYSRYLLKKFPIKQGYMVDTDYPEKVVRILNTFPQFKRIAGNFGSHDIAAAFEKVDTILLFDVQLHQVAPDCQNILAMYAPKTRSFIIYNQQLINAPKTLRLTDLPLQTYKEYAPVRSDSLYDFVYSHQQELHPQHQKIWKNIHNIWQWGITDEDLIAEMQKFGFKEIFRKNYGRFSDLKHFENHGFVFVRK